MKLTKFIIGLIFISAVLCNYKQATPWSQVFAQVSETGEFGKSMASLIQMHIKTSDVNSRLQEISELINSIKAQLVERNEAEAERIKAYNEKTDAELARLQTLLDSLEAQKAKLEKEQKELMDEQSTKSVALTQEKTNYENLNNDLNQNLENLETENTSYETKSNDYNTLIIACNAGIDLMTHMVHGEIEYGSRNGANFLQLVQIKNQFTSVLDSFKKHSSIAMLQPVLNSLAQVSTSTSINYEQFMQCLELIIDIRDRLSQDLVVLTNRHNQIVADLEAIIANIRGEIKISGSLIDIYTQRLAEIAERLPQISSELDENTDLTRVNQKALMRLKEEQENENADYDEQKMIRAGQISVLNKLIEYFDNEVATNVGNVRNDAV